MATQAKAPPAGAKEVPHIMLEIPYSSKLVIPAHLAGALLPYIRVVLVQYNTELQRDIYQLSTENIHFMVLSAEDMISATVTAALAGG